MNPNLVILAGGISSRMKRPQQSNTGIDKALLNDSRQKTKSMIGVGEHHRPFLDYLLYNAREAGYREVVIVVGENASDIREHYGKSDRSNQFHGISISYAAQKIPEGRTKPLGTADALLHALDLRPDWSGQTFTVCNSDNLYSRNVLRLLLDTPHSCAVIDYDRDALRFAQERIEQFAIIQKDGSGFLTRIVEKPTGEQLTAAADAKGRIGVSMNIFRFDYDLIAPILKRVPLHPVRKEKEIPSAVMMLIEGNPQAMMTIPRAEYVPDLTNPGDLPHVQKFLKEQYLNFSWDN